MCDNSLGLHEIILESLKGDTVKLFNDKKMIILNNGESKSFWVGSVQR